MHNIASGNMGITTIWNQFRSNSNIKVKCNQCNSVVQLPAKNASPQSAIVLDLILQLIQRWQLIHRLRRCLPKPGSEGWQVVFHIQWLAHIALLLVQIAHQIKNASSVFKEYFDHGAGQGTINTWRRRNSSSVSLGLRTSLYPLLSRVTCYRCGIPFGPCA